MTQVNLTQFKYETKIYLIMSFCETPSVLLTIYVPVLKSEITIEDASLIFFTILPVMS